MVILQSALGGMVEIDPQGAQVLRWRSPAGVEILYCSPMAFVEDAGRRGRPVRGGIPVCFPQFAARGRLPKHGFARTSPWHLKQVDAASTEACFELTDSENTRAVWPHNFTATLEASLEPGSLALALSVANTGELAFSFTAALHTYLQVDDVCQVRLWGLQGVHFEDALAANAVKRQKEDALHIAGELDRVYLDTPDSLRLVHPDGACIHIGQQGFTDTVVWNPGPTKVVTLGDMPVEDWQRMLCVEAACVQTPVQLAPGQRWQGVQTLTTILRGDPS